MKIILYKCDLCNSTFQLHKIKNDKIEVYPNTLNSLQGHTEGQISMILEHMKIEVCPECMERIEAKVIMLENKIEVN